MSAPPKVRARWFLAVAVIFAAVLIKFTAYDTLRLAWFSHRIAGTDRIVATYWPSSVSVTITGDDVKKVVRVISSAGSGRPPFGTDWANIYDVNVRFYSGTKALGEIEIDSGGLFLIHYHRPPFRESSGLLVDLVHKPVLGTAHQAELKRAGGQ